MASGVVASDPRLRGDERVLGWRPGQLLPSGASHGAQRPWDPALKGRKFLKPDITNLLFRSRMLILGSLGPGLLCTTEQSHLAMNFNSWMIECLILLAQKKNLMCRWFLRNCLNL